MCRPLAAHGGRGLAHVLWPALAGPLDLDRDGTSVARAEKKVEVFSVRGRLHDRAIEGCCEDLLSALFYRHSHFYCASRLGSFPRKTSLSASPDTPMPQQMKKLRDKDMSRRCQTGAPPLRRLAAAERGRRQSSAQRSRHRQAWHQAQRLGWRGHRDIAQAAHVKLSGDVEGAYVVAQTRASDAPDRRGVAQREQECAGAALDRSRRPQDPARSASVEGPPSAWLGPAGLRKAPYGAAGAPAAPRARLSPQVEAVEAHHLRERRSEVLDELLRGVIGGVDLGDRTQLGV